MKKKNMSWLEVVAVAGIMVIAFAVLVLLVPAMNSEVAAAWVQAIGSIAAIVAAVLITEYQHRKSVIASDQASALESLRHLNGLLMLVTGAYAIIQLASKAFHSGSRGMVDNYFVTTYSPGDLEDIAASLGQFELHALAGEVTGILFVKRILHRLEKYLSHFAIGQYTDADYRSMVERLEKDERFIADMVAEINQAILRESVRVNDGDRVRAVMNIQKPSTPK